MEFGCGRYCIRTVSISRSTTIRDEEEDSKSRVVVLMKPLLQTLHYNYLFYSNYVERDNNIYTFASTMQV